MLKLLLCLVIFTLSASTNGAKILGVFMTPSYSHQVVYQPIWKELSLRGHDVTIITPNPLRDPTLTNLTEIDVSESYKIWKTFDISKLGTKGRSILGEVTTITNAFAAVLEYQLENPQVRAIIDNEETFDLLLVEYLYPGMYAFKDVCKCPMVGITSLGLTAYGAEQIGNPKHPVLDPELVLPFSTELSFVQRVCSVLFQNLFKYGTKLLGITKMDAAVKKGFGKEVRSVDTLAREVSLVIVNSNNALNPIRPMVPGFIEISGIHIQPKKPLPKDLQILMDNATEGIIYFSLGSNIKSTSLPKEKLDILMSAFEELPYKILWKFETDDIGNKSQNVEIRKWLPQQDVLGHKNVKLFITQGGLQSLDEAMHNEKPVLIIPFFGDQHGNAMRLTQKEVALNINFDAFTKEELKTKILTLIKEPKYLQNAKKLRAIASDQPIPALEKAIWWIEYVLRHDGAYHLRYAGVNLPFYQYWLLDVLALFTVLGLIGAYISLKVLQRIYNSERMQSAIDTCWTRPRTAVVQRFTNIFPRSFRTNLTNLTTERPHQD